MSDDLDARLRDSLSALAPEPGTDGVYAHVAAAKRVHRQRVRRAQVATVSAVAVVAIAILAVSLTGGDSPTTVATSAPLTARVVVGADVGDGPIASVGTRVPLTALELRPDEGYLRGPLPAAGSVLTTAAYDRLGRGFTVPPSRVVRARVPSGLGSGGGSSGGSDGGPDGRPNGSGSTARVTDRVDLQGEILSLADGEGARWALTHDKEVLGPDDPEFRVKRIGPDGVAVSNPVPPGSVPAGDIVAFGGGVWLPVRDGVLRFDSATGAFADRIALEVPAQRRGIAAFQKFVAVTDGDRLVRLDPASDQPAEAVQTVVDAQLASLTGAAGDLESSWLLGDRTTGPGALLYTQHGFGGPTDAVALPRRVEATTLRSANGVTWIDATVRGRPAALVLSTTTAAVAQTIVLPAGRDVAITFADRHHAVVAVDGQLRTLRV